MLENLHSRKKFQLGLGFLFGIVFGFLLQKGGVTQYNVIIGQLLLTDFTVAKIMLSATVTGMLGVYFLKSLGLSNLHPKAGALGTNVIGGLLFGIGFGILGYCPGTIAGAVGNGSLDVLVGGIAGIILGAGAFAELYPKLEAGILNRGYYGAVTLPELLGVGQWVVVLLVAALLTGVLWGLEKAGF